MESFLLCCAQCSIICARSLSGVIEVNDVNTRLYVIQTACRILSLRLQEPRPRNQAARFQFSIPRRLLIPTGRMLKFQSLISLVYRSLSQQMLTSADVGSPSDCRSKKSTI